MIDRAHIPSRTTTSPAALFLASVLALAACASGAGSTANGVVEEGHARDTTSTTVWGPEYLAPAVPGSAPSPPGASAPTAAPATGSAVTAPPVSAGSTPGAPGAPSALPEGHDTTVSRITDGDTIVVGGDVRVRLIGMDTPETQDPRTSVQCFGPEASRHTAELLPPGTAVRLVYDVDRTDRYGRTLAYVYRLSDGLFVNVALVRDGYARIATYPPNVAHVEEIRAAETEAREAGRGLWGGCPAGGTVSTTATTAAVVSPAPLAGGAGACDPSYPDVCIPPAPPDLDCGQITPRRFRVLGADPHRFDSDGDGVGCES
jgi:micrococcal nuclease